MPYRQNKQKDLLLGYSCLKTNMFYTDFEDRGLICQKICVTPKFVFWIDFKKF